MHFVYDTLFTLSAFDVVKKTSCKIGKICVKVDNKINILSNAFNSFVFKLVLLLLQYNTYNLILLELK